MKKHMKRLAAPKSWPLGKKAAKFVTRPLPKSRFDSGVPLSLALKLLGYAETSREVKKIVNNQEVLIDKKRVKNHRLLIGLMDTLEIPSINACFRVLMNRKGKVCLVKEENAGLKPCRINSKKMLKGRVQLLLHDSRTLLTDSRDYKTGDTIILQLPKQEIIEHLKPEKGVFAYLCGGKKIGELAKIEAVLPEKIVLRTDSESFETKKEFVFVIGRDKPFIKIK
jgi:small subunit ribosomal protein S4e